MVLRTPCKDVVSSCALLAREQIEGDVKVDTTNQSSVQKIERELNEGLVRQLQAKLGDEFFADITFNMEQPLLPEVDGAIATAQAAYAKVADVRAEKLREQEQTGVERQKRATAAQRQKQYATCPSCARQDKLRSLPRGLLSLGSDAGITVGRP